MREVHQLYCTASVSIKCNDGLKSFHVNFRVLQKKCLSPLLFSLFIVDIDCVSLKGAQSLNIDSISDLLLLLDADDFAIFAHSEIDVAKSL